MKSFLASILMMILHFLTPERKTYSFRKRLWMIMKYFGLWLIIFLAGLAPIILSIPPLMFVLVFLGLVLLMIFLIFRRNHIKLQRAVVMTGLMGLIVILSLL